MFPEYRALISQLKTTHPRFQALFEKHNDLDHQISRIENGEGQGYGQQLSNGACPEEAAGASHR